MDLKSIYTCPICRTKGFARDLGTFRVDLDEPAIICKSCFDKRVNVKDVGEIDGHYLCTKKGCINDSFPFHKYCQDHYDEAYPGPIDAAINIADLNHVVINAAMNIQALTTDERIEEECSKIIEIVRKYTGSIQTEEAN